MTWSALGFSFIEVLDDHLIPDLEREHFVPVLKPKIDGTLTCPQSRETVPVSVGAQLPLLVVSGISILL